MRSIGFAWKPGAWVTASWVVGAWAGNILAPEVRLVIVPLELRTAVVTPDDQ